MLETLHAIVAPASRCIGHLWGDIRGYDRGPTRTLEELAMPARLRPSPAAPPGWVQRMNFNLCRPLLLAAIDGDAASRAAYARNRLLTFSTLPEWAQTELRSRAQIAANTFQGQPKLPLDGLDRRGRRFMETKFSKVRITIDDELLEEFGLDRFITFESASEAVERISRITKLQSTSGSWIRTGGAPLLDVNFSLFEEGPLGSLLRAHVPRLVEMMYRARIIEDILAVHAVPLGDQHPRSILTAKLDPWEIPYERRMRNAIELAGEFDRPGTVLPVERKAEIIERHLKAKDPVGSALREFAPETPTSVPLPSTPTAPADRSLEQHRARFIAGTAAAIEQYAPGTEDIGRLARALYRFTTRGALTYASILAALEAGTSPYQILEDAHAECRAPYEVGTKTPSSSSSSRHPSRLEASERKDAERLVRLEFPVPARGLSFAKWLDVQDRDTQSRIRARLFRMQHGNEGDHRTVRAGLYEARLHFGQGYRIYYTKPEKGCIRILGGGTKATQDTDIADAIGRMPGKPK